MLETSVKYEIFKHYLIISKRRISIIFVFLLSLFNVTIHIMQYFYQTRLIFISIVDKNAYINLENSHVNSLAGFGFIWSWAYIKYVYGVIEIEKKNIIKTYKPNILVFCWYIKQFRHVMFKPYLHRNGNIVSKYFG